MHPTALKQLEDWFERVVLEGEPIELLWNANAGDALRLYLTFARAQFALLGKGDAEALGDELCGVRLVAQILDQPELHIR